MQLARVIGEVVSSVKDANLVGAKLLVLQPIAASGENVGRTLVALDSVGALIGPLLAMALMIWFALSRAGKARRRSWAI